MIKFISVIGIRNLEHTLNTTDSIYFIHWSQAWVPKLYTLIKQLMQLKKT